MIHNYQLRGHKLHHFVQDDNNGLPCLIDEVHDWIEKNLKQYQIEGIDFRPYIDMSDNLNWLATVEYT